MIMKKMGISFVAMIFVLAGSSLFANDLSSVVGCWKTRDDKTKEIKSIVQISESGGTVSGKILKLMKDPDAKCTECKGSLKDQPIQGMRIIWGVKKVGEKSGRILDPASGKTYKLMVKRNGANLWVRGYIGFFYRTQTWYPSSCQ